MEANTQANTPQASTPAAPAPERTGPVAAVMLAAGIGALTLAVLTIWAEASEGFKASITYSDSVGPLAGKTIWATALFFGSWAALYAVLRKVDLDLKKVAIATVVLLGLALVGTFSPFFELFKAD